MSRIGQVTSELVGFLVLRVAENNTHQSSLRPTFKKLIEGRLEQGL